MLSGYTSCSCSPVTRTSTTQRYRTGEVGASRYVRLAGSETNRFGTAGIETDEHGDYAWLVGGSLRRRTRTLGWSALKLDPVTSCT